MPFQVFCFGAGPLLHPFPANPCRFRSTSHRTVRSQGFVRTIGAAQEVKRMARPPSTKQTFFEVRVLWVAMLVHGLGYAVRSSDIQLASRYASGVEVGLASRGKCRGI